MEYPSGFSKEKFQHKPICGVLAVALCAGVSYPVAHAACKRNMPAGKKRFGGRTTHKQQDTALKSLGVKFNAYGPNNGRKITVRGFIEQMAKPDVTYLVRVTGHVFVVHNNCITDQTGSSHYLFWTRTCRQRVVNFLEIIGVGW